MLINGLYIINNFDNKIQNSFSYVNNNYINFFDNFFDFKIFNFFFSNSFLNINYFNFSNNIFDSFIFIINCYDNDLFIIDNFYLTFFYEIFFFVSFLNSSITIYYYFLINDYKFFNLLADDINLISTVVYDIVYNEFLNSVFTSEIINVKPFYNNNEVVKHTFNLFFFNFIFYFFIFFFFDTSRNSRINKVNDLFFFKIFIFLDNISKNYRLNFQIIIFSIIFTIESFIFSIMQSNSHNIEFVEFLHTSIVYFIFIIIIFLLYKYSIHYFSFLEQSVTEGESSSFIAKQFIRDLSNTFALFLRFFLLLFRLNIYDGLDDFLDSYCIFFAEFSEMNELNHNSNLYIFGIDYSFNIYNDSGDLSIDDIDLFYLMDFFIIYFENLIEASNYWLFLLEEIFRLVLAIYIIYLIILEVHTVNFNYIEDTYFNFKR